MASQPNVDTFNAFNLLNKKSRSTPASSPVGLIVYDALVLDGKDLTEKTLKERRQALHEWFNHNNAAIIYQNLSRALLKAFVNYARFKNRAVEGLMIKR